MAIFISNYTANKQLDKKWDLIA